DLHRHLGHGLSFCYFADRPLELIPRTELHNNLLCLGKDAPRALFILIEPNHESFWTSHLKSNRLTMSSTDLRPQSKANDLCTLFFGQLREGGCSVCAFHFCLHCCNIRDRKIDLYPAG